ncbi:MAG: hypothetical protein V5A45_06625 [Haloarculaceae archaeon]
MEPTTIERVIALTESVLEETDDKEQTFKLRTALQLLEIINERQEAANNVLADCEIDDQVRENLQELGYLEEDRR